MVVDLSSTEAIPTVDDVTRRKLISIALLAGFIIACGDDTNQAARPSGEDVRITIDHIYGSTTVPARPQRVVTLGFHEQDFFYALGVKPVGVHVQGAMASYGLPHGGGPWTTAASANHAASLATKREIDLEWVASLNPDLITVIQFATDLELYDRLSQIAPVVAQPRGYELYTVPWRDKLRFLASAIGMSAKAEAIIAGLDKQLVDFRNSHPQLQGAKTQTPYVLPGEFSVYPAKNTTNTLLADMGMTIPQDFDALITDVSVRLSFEQVNLLDILDVIVLYGSEADIRSLESQPTYRSLRVSREGRAFRPNDDLQNALNAHSPLSIPYVLDHLGPRLVAAVDGNPATR